MKYARACCGIALAATLALSACSIGGSGDGDRPSELTPEERQRAIESDRAPRKGTPQPPPGQRTRPMHARIVALRNHFFVGTPGDGLIREYDGRTGRRVGKPVDAGRGFAGPWATTNDVLAIDRSRARIVHVAPGFEYAQVDPNERPLYIADDGSSVALYAYGTRAGATLQMLQPHTFVRDKPLRIPVEPVAVAATEGAVWLADGHAPRLIPVDEQSGRPLGPPAALPGRPVALTSGAGLAVLTRRIGRGVVVDLDPARGSERSGRFTTAGAPVALASTADSLWVVSATGGRGVVERVDRQTMRRWGRPFVTPRPLTGAAYAGGSLWAVDDTGGIARVRPADTGGPRPLGPGSGPPALARPGRAGGCVRALDRRTGRRRWTVPAPILSARLRETSVEVRWRFARRTTSAACRPGLIVLNLHAIRRDYGREIAVRARSGRILIPFDGGDLPHRLSAEVRAADGPGVNYASKRVR